MAGRKAQTPEQRILDIFSEMETGDQITLLVKLQEMYDCFVKRDARLAATKKEPSPRKRRTEPDQPLEGKA